jgi:hypothetical protein
VLLAGDAGQDGARTTPAWSAATSRRPTPPSTSSTRCSCPRADHHTTQPRRSFAPHSATSAKSKAPHLVTAFEWKQPRAVDAGKRGLGQPARHNASAATGAARGCRGRVATGSDRQSGGRACRLEGGGGRRTVMRVVPVPSSGHLDGGSLPDPALVRPFPCDGL